MYVCMLNKDPKGLFPDKHIKTLSPLENGLVEPKVLAGNKDKKKRGTMSLFHNQ